MGCVCTTACTTCANNTCLHTFLEDVWRSALLAAPTILPRKPVWVMMVDVWVSMHHNNKAALDKSCTQHATHTWEHLACPAIIHHQQHFAAGCNVDKVKLHVPSRVGFILCTGMGHDACMQT